MRGVSLAVSKTAAFMMAQLVSRDIPVSANHRSLRLIVSQSGEFDVIIIGAGPSGALASALLVKKGYRVLVLEKERFPRFSIGESLLPQCMAYLEEANMLRAVHDEGFQLKNGAAFQFRSALTDFDFRRKLSPGWGTTYQVQRARFDQILADQAVTIGADIRYTR